MNLDYYVHILALSHVVYMQSLSHILQIMAAPLLQVIEEEIQRNKDKLEKLKKNREHLSSILGDTELDRV